MKQFTVEDDLVSLIWKLAEPEPFENLSFSAALRRVVTRFNEQDHSSTMKARRPTADELLAELASMDDTEFAERHPNFEKPKRRVRAPSPNPHVWLNKVPELSPMASHLRTWDSICNHLKIEVGGDSGRRRLATWVEINRPNWPPVPSPER